jgi:hypothetical protein
MFTNLCTEELSSGEQQPGFLSNSMLAFAHSMIIYGVLE